MADIELVIKIPEEIHKKIQSGEFWLSCGLTLSNAYDYIKNGTPIPDNATVGEVFCMLACKEPICETASYFTIDKNLWNAPYQKGGKDDTYRVYG